MSRHPWATSGIALLCLCLGPFGVFLISLPILAFMIHLGIAALNLAFDARAWEGNIWENQPTRSTPPTTETPTMNVQPPPAD